MEYTTLVSTLWTRSKRKRLFHRLFNLGRTPYVAVFRPTLRDRPARRISHRCRRALPYWAEHRRQYFSIFGKLAFW